MKQITHTINGKQITLDFGKMWFSKYYGEATSSNPLLMNELIDKPNSQFTFICGLIYGGVNCYNKTNKINEFLTLEQTEDLVGSMTQEEAAELINKFVDTNSSKEQGEVNPQVANP
jgi:hypothetical protein